MPRFAKGVYCIKKSELEQLNKAYSQGEVIILGGKEFIPLYIKPKTKDIHIEDFEDVVFDFDTKKDIFVALSSTAYKLDKFMEATYKTVNLQKIRDIIKSRGTI